MPLQSARPGLDIPDIPLFDLIFGDLADADAAQPAIVDSGNALTFGELRDQVEAFAGALAHRGIGPGDVVALHCPNSSTFAVAFHGILRAGATCSTIAVLATADDVARQLTACGASMLLTTSSIGWAGPVGAGKAGLSEDAVIGLTGTHGIAEMIAEGHPAPDVRPGPDDVAVIPFSSGTTGAPKGVQLTHGNMVANVLQTADALRDRMTAGTRVLTVLPYFHIYGMNTLLNHCLYRRATQFTMSRFALPEFLYLIEKEAISFVFIAPPIAVALAKHPFVDDYDVSSLDVVLSGAASLQNDLARAVEDRIGCVVAQGFGMTESSPVTHVRVGHDAPLDSIGRAVANTEYAIVDIDDPALPEIPLPESGRSRAGELWVRGPQVMKGYLNNAEATAATLVDGWLRTGDIAEMDAYGNVYIVDRLKELIKYKGYQVPPAELEDVLLAHPDVADAACIGHVRAADAEEVPKAFIVLADGAEADAAGIMEFVADRVAPYKRVRAVEFIDAIPKSATGKILRRELKARDRAEA